MFRKMKDRVANEPALLVTAVIAVAALFGADLTNYQDILDSVMIIIGGFLIRRQVTPTRKLQSINTDQP